MNHSVLHVLRHIYVSEVVGDLELCLALHRKPFGVFSVCVVLYVYPYLVPEENLGGFLHTVQEGRARKMF